MDEKDNSRSSLQTAADLGRAAKAAYRIAQAAAVSGVHGAAAAAVKETVPALVKFLLVVLLIMIVIPMVVFTALPNIFFGYDSSDTASVIHMTEQAMRIGGAYMSLDDFERTQIDSIVTGIAAEYEADGTAIDHIEVKNTMKEDDLLWIIAINSAAYEQDLDAMSAELIQNFCQSTLSYQPSLSLLGGSTSATLEVEIKRIDPEELMEQMGFNEDARQWAGTLFETLKDSGALEKYGGYFSAYQPDYSGDGSYSGDIQHGTSYDILEILKEFKYLRVRQLHALVQAHYRTQGIKIDERRMEIMLRQMRTGTNYVWLRGDVVSYGDRRIDPRLLEALDVMLELTKAQPGFYSKDGLHEPFLLRFTGNGKGAGYLFSVAWLDAATHIATVPRMKGERIIWISESGSFGEIDLPRHHFFAARQKDGTHRFFGSNEPEKI